MAASSSPPEGGNPFAGEVLGGQAVLEGVMMRARGALAVAVRAPDGRILVRRESWKEPLAAFPGRSLPLLRGAMALVETLVNGLRALTWSARIMEGKGEGSGPDGHLGKGALVLTMATALALALGLFVALPHLLTALLGWWAGPGSLPIQGVAFHLVDGALKLLILLAYLWVVGRLPDMARVFGYHGAEHQVIAAFEAGLPRTVEAAQGCPRLHPRCGTSFLLLVVMASLLVFALVLPWVPQPAWSTPWRHLYLVAVKIPLMFPVAGIAYELVRYSGRHATNPWIRPLILPGLWLQRLTTRVPDPLMVEVSLAALAAALEGARLEPSSLAEPQERWLDSPAQAA